ncbi:acyl-CoA carboxylase subunit epsilon [Leifsonia sp. F6_8S_P_1B]|uniref:Acyl-CoA carboxylase subunit epsilon n=1 Tax=Leifsonia williamsii TaxID=3035919 RepID=A0ABT8KDJ7_9MICO|nr:acyl-CoA carboxylase subunit epsilon [Leifsonia williamsii]MDN4614399.1 acyl-CoA carboxylase subunit epsilon [Leifsonia williamsii]
MSDAPLDPSQLRFLTRGVTPEEIAAVTAVLTAAAAEAAAAARAARPQHGQDAWARSQRQLRQPLTPGPGAWRSFSA